MFRKALAFSALALLITSSAMAVKLINRDSSSYDIKIDCNGSRSQSSIGASSTRDLGSGPCTVTIVSSGATATASGSSDLMIEGGVFK